MRHRFDFAQAYYWRIQFIEPENPDDDRYVVLYGDEGEIVGPLSMSIAQEWLDHRCQLVGRQAISLSRGDRG